MWFVIGGLSMTGKEIREFFRDVFGNRMVAQLSEDLLRLRSDMDQRLQDKDRTVAILREDIQRLQSKVAVYEATIMPHSSRMGAEVAAYVKPTKPNFSFTDIGPTKSKWEQIQDEHDAQMRKELEDDKAATAATKE
jgi:hypothetical protein